MDVQDLRSFGVVRNIPSVFHSSNLRNFFSDFTENVKFRCFHYKHRPEVTKPKIEGDGKPEKTGTCCCVFQAVDEKSLTECITKYNDANWINDKGDYLKARCIVQKIKVSDDVRSDKNKATISETEYATRGEAGYKKRHAVTESFSQSDLMSLSELRPPVHVMPRGNIGTTLKEFLELVKQCKLPPKIIKKLDLKFPKTGSARRFGNVPFQYNDTWENVAQGQNIYTANGDSVETSISLESDEVSEKQEKPSLDEETLETGEKSDPDADDDTCEEWERHEALHNDVTSMERTKERLFEEEIELKWEKGGSGLVFYTDAQYWHEQEGDFDEQTTDDWDVDMSEYYGERGDLDARQYLQMRRERRNGKAVYDDSLSCDLFRHDKKRSRSASPPSTKRRGDFERHTKGVGRKLLEKGGWTEGDPLGPGKRSDAITDPIDLEGQHPKLRKGLGYHGDKILKPTEEKNFLRMRKPIKIPSHNRDGTTTSTFRGNRSVEPLATHSWIFPQFASNLTNNEYKERTKEARKHAVPGPDDGVVITTAYDEPLRIDEQNDFLRSFHPTALKHRATKNTDQNASNRDFTCNPKPIRHGSKLVRRPRDDASELALKYTKNADQTRASSSSTIQLSTVKFVKGGVLNEE